LYCQGALALFPEQLIRQAFKRRMFIKYHYTIKQMKKLPGLFYATLFAMVTNAQSKDVQQLTSQFDQLLSKQFNANESGATALVARKGQIIYKKAFGMANMELNVPMQADNVFRIGSITKQFTAVAILQLAEQGKLNLQDDITRFLPDYPTQGAKITIEHLLTHTSGIQNYTNIKDTISRSTADFTPAKMVDYFKGLQLRFAPGSRWEYSNSGYFILGYIIEKVSGQPYASYLEEHFFKPIGMTNSRYGSDLQLVKNRVDGYTKGDKGFENSPYISMTQPYAAGAIQSTVEDLFKWQQAVHSGKLLKKESLEKALTRYKLTDGSTTSYGYGWRLGNLYESPTIWHGGLINGFITMAMYLPKEDIFVAVFSNCECNSPEGTTSKLAALAMGRPLEYKAITLAASDLNNYTGVYENEAKQQRIITAAESGLFVQANRGPKSLVKPYQKDKFYNDKDAMQTIAFIRNAKGNIEKLITESMRGNEVWIRTDKPIPSADGIKVDEQLLEKYVGQYQVTPEFTFQITKEGGKLFLQAKGQEKLEIFAETETRFFLKVNDAQLEFVRDDSGNVVKAIMNQGGRKADAKKVLKN
jgi:CubicO group peptidase (beta-lactamase class C family)